MIPPSEGKVLVVMDTTLWNKVLADLPWESQAELESVEVFTEPHLLVTRAPKPLGGFRTHVYGVYPTRAMGKKAERDVLNDHPATGVVTAVTKLVLDPERSK